MKRENCFFGFASMVLLFTAIAKLYGASGTTKILSSQDGLLHVNYGFLMASAGFVEICVAIYLLKADNILMRAMLLLWLSINFMAYHFGNYLLGISVCPCLGSLSDRLPLPHGYAEHLLQLFTAYWFMGSSYLVWRDWIAEQEAKVGMSTEPAIPR